MHWHRRDPEPRPAGLTVANRRPPQFPALPTADLPVHIGLPHEWWARGLDGNQADLVVGPSIPLSVLAQRHDLVAENIQRLVGFDRAFQHGACIVFAAAAEREIDPRGHMAVDLEMRVQPLQQRRQLVKILQPRDVSFRASCVPQRPPAKLTETIGMKQAGRKIRAKSMQHAMRKTRAEQDCACPLFSPPENSPPKTVLAQFTDNPPVHQVGPGLP